MPELQGHEGRAPVGRLHGPDVEEELTTEGVAEHTAVSGEQRYLEPGWLVSRVVNPVLMRLGITPTLAVRGRTSGEWRTVPVNVLELAGQRYLVAPRGDTQWVRNLRATGGGELRRRGGSSPSGLPRSPTTRSRALSRRISRAGATRFGRTSALPNAADHPVFSACDRASPAGLFRSARDSET